MSQGTRASIVLPVIRLTPYLRVRITVDDQALEIEHTPSLAGVVPLGRRRLRVPLNDLATASVVRFLRVDCVAVAAGLLGLVAVARPPLALSLVLIVLAIFEILLTIQPRRATRVGRTDGRTWTVPFCRFYEFDASLAIEDALARSAAAKAKSLTIAGLAETPSNTAADIAGRSRGTRTRA
jgi:hypothetical protein